jgi:hypothetical protein
MLRKYSERAAAPAGLEVAARFGATETSRPAPLTIIAGGGVTDEMIALLAGHRCVDEVHVGRAARDGNDPTAAVSAARVRRLCELLVL